MDDENMGKFSHFSHIKPKTCKPTMNDSKERLFLELKILEICRQVSSEENTQKEGIPIGNKLKKKNIQNAESQNLS